MSHTITTTYTNPDLDGYGCVFAHAELLRSQGIEASSHIWGTPLLEVKWLINEFSLQETGGELTYTEAEIVFLDSSEPSSLPSPLAPEKVVEIIDHRRLHQADKFPNAKIQIEMVGAAATLVAERFQKTNTTPSRDAALYLYGGILSNTQNFTGIVTDRDRMMAEWLKEVSSAPDNLAHNMFEAKSDLTGDRLQEELKGDSKILLIQGQKVGTMQLEIIEAKKLLKDRLEEIESSMSKFSANNSCDYMFLNIKDVFAGTSLVVTIDEQTKSLLEQWNKIEFDNNVGFAKEGVLRKVITAWIDTKLAS